MFEPQAHPRVFAQAPGVDFPQALVDGLRHRLAAAPPDAMTRVHLIVNTRRMARRIREIFDAGPPCLLPRVSLLTDLDEINMPGSVPQAISALRRRLEIGQFVARLLDAQPDLAARSSMFDLADSLAELLDEMEGEGVPPDAIDKLDVSDLSGHWERAKSFISLTRSFYDNEGAGLDAQARQRRIILGLSDHWKTNPPDHPVILAGSTGSRGTTLLLMCSVAHLPQGALVLPGFDFDMPQSAWDDLKPKDSAHDHLPPEDHPQFRFRKLMDDLGLSTAQIRPWFNISAPAPARNRAISLALRPAPVTHAWLNEGPRLVDLPQAFGDVTLLEAPTPRTEAQAIAMRLREAAETGQRAALITPDRMLTRQVTAALGRWGILPDDSAGLPLHLSPPGRFLRHVGHLFQRRLTTDQLLTLLKHPLTHSGTDRGPHLRATRELELHLRRAGVPFPDIALITAWAEARSDLPPGWIHWLGPSFWAQRVTGERPLSEWITNLHNLAEQISGNGSGPGALWEQKAGREAKDALDNLTRDAGFGGSMTAADFNDLLGAVLSRGEVRDRDAPHPDIMIWGTLEARVQGAQLLILGGLNEGTWPEAVRPDPWLNRSLRAKAGLLLPDRRIGLSAHDFQQAAGAPEVWLTRAIRSDDAQTVPSRWINRLTNLLSGLSDQGGDTTLCDMRTRGQSWLRRAQLLEETSAVPAAARPSPRPPVPARPTQLSVTEIKRLIRDPYAIYAKHVLRLRPLDPLVRLPDARAKGIVVHDVLEAFVKSLGPDDISLDRARFLEFAKTALDKQIPWPAARLLWLGQLGRSADWFLSGEEQRRKRQSTLSTEARAQANLKDPAFTLVARADRIDRDVDGRLILYDYKTGTPPTEKQQRAFDKQLLLEAAMAEAGDFDNIPPAKVARAVFIGLGATRETDAPIDDEPPAKVWSELRELITAYLDPSTGFTARRMLEKDTDVGDYDQLARFGEWDETDPTSPEDVT